MSSTRKDVVSDYDPARHVMCAVRDDNLDTLQHNNLLVLDEDGANAVTHGAYKGKMKSLKYLATRENEFKILVNLHTFRGLYPLLGACEQGLDFVVFLLGHGARILLPTNAKGTPLSILHEVLSGNVAQDQMLDIIHALIGDLLSVVSDPGSGETCPKYSIEERAYILNFRSDMGVEWPPRADIHYFPTDIRGLEQNDCPREPNMLIPYEYALALHNIKAAEMLRKAQEAICHFIM